MKRTIALLFVLPLVLLACESSTEPLDVAGVCQRPADSGDLGCALLAGRIKNAEGGGQMGVLVTAVPFDELATGAVFLSDTVASDTAGRYQLYVTLKSPPSIDPPLDTVSVLVKATLPPPEGSPAGTPARSKDVAMILHLQPAGASLDTVEVFSMAF